MHITLISLAASLFLAVSSADSPPTLVALNEKAVMPLSAGTVPRAGDFEVIPTIGTARGGEPCTSPSDCASGWCQTWTDPQTGMQRQECFEACEQDADCPSGIPCYLGLQLVSGEVGRMNTCASLQ